jgi:hypothetical protein
MQLLAGHDWLCRTIIKSREALLVLARSEPNSVVHDLRNGSIRISRFQVYRFVMRRLKTDRGALGRFFAHEATSWGGIVR